MKNCVKCGVLIPHGKHCGACRAYIRRGGVWHTPPKHGTVAYDNEGRPICHICGMSYDKLIEHTKRKHGLDSVTYRQTFGLMFSARLTGPGYRKKMQQHAETHKTFKKNFETTHSGEKRYTEGRKPGWSAQEIEARRRAQVKNGRQSKKNLSPVQLKELGKIWAKNLPNKREV